MAPKFDWNQFPAEGAEAPAAAPSAQTAKSQGAAPAKKPGKFSWDQFPVEGGEDAPRGEKVYDQPAGPEQASVIDRAIERVKDPQRWRAIATGEGPYGRKDVVQGDVPLVVPAGALGRAGQLLVKLGEGGGAGAPILERLGYSAGRTALSTAHGAAMSAMDRKEGESYQETADRVKEGAKLSGGIQAAVEAVPYVGKALSTAARKVGSAISGVDESLLTNYAKRTDEVNDLIKQSGGDMTAAADQVRTELSDGIQKTKRDLSGKISEALKKSSPEPSASVQSIVDRLEAYKAKLNPNLKADAVAEIDDMIGKVIHESSQTNADGLVTPSQMYELKQFLTENAKGAYQKNGQIFTRSTEAARAAKEAAQEAREILKPVLPEISQADAQLSKLHAIEGRLNKNLLAAEKPDAALFSAGAGKNPRNAATLRELEKISGVPVSQRTQDLATAKTFASPALTPSSGMTTATARMLGAAGLGYAAGGKEGAMVVGAAASPMGMKLAINAARVGKGMALATKVPQVMKFARENPVAASTLAQLGARQVRDANETAPEPAAEPQRLMDDAPKGGPERWARNGIDRLGIQDPELASKLLQSKEGKRLLIEASDLPEGSRALKRIQEQIQKGWGKDGRDSLSGTAAKVSGQQREPARRR
jgi:gas vesicle protein